MRFFIPIILWTAFTTTSVFAATPEAIAEDVIVAKVNDENIYKSGIDVIVNDFKRTGTVIDEKTRKTLIERLVEQKLVAQFAKKQGYDKRDDVKKQIQVMTEMVLRDKYFSDLVTKHVTKDAVKAEFDKKMAQFKEKFEYKAAHILVDSQTKAQEIKTKLNNGKKFIDLAQQYSSDSNAESGGDLGYFSVDMMVKPFSDAVEKLSIGQISEPVKTDFGWHIITLTDKRALPKPTLEQSTPQIEAQLARDLMVKHIAELKKQSDIQIYQETKRLK
jgi:peptidyl-prolyl cis-trans isomerase C